MSAENPAQSRFFDGDGKRVKEVIGGVTERYYLVSSVLGARL